jgi:hypothetical protein
MRYGVLGLRQEGSLIHYSEKTCRFSPKIIDNELFLVINRVGWA